MSKIHQGIVIQVCVSSLSLSLCLILIHIAPWVYIFMWVSGVKDKLIL